MTKNDRQQINPRNRERDSSLGNFGRQPSPLLNEKRTKTKSQKKANDIINPYVRPASYSIFTSNTAAL